MRPAIFLLFPILTAVIVATFFLRLAVRADSKGAGRYILVPFFLYCSYIVANVSAASLDAVIPLLHPNDTGLGGVIVRVLLSDFIYAAVILAISRIILFKNIRSMFIFILLSGTVFAVTFDLFLTVF